MSIYVPTTTSSLHWITGKDKNPEPTSYADKPLFDRKLVTKGRLRNRLLPLKRRVHIDYTEGVLPVIQRFGDVKRLITRR